MANVIFSQDGVNQGANGLLVFLIFSSRSHFNAMAEIPRVPILQSLAPPLGGNSSIMRAHPIDLALISSHLAEENLLLTQV